MNIEVQQKVAFLMDGFRPLFNNRGFKIGNFLIRGKIRKDTHDGVRRLQKQGDEVNNEPHGRLLRT
jgi:hypothetical protein